MLEKLRMRRLKGEAARASEPKTKTESPAPHPPAPSKPAADVVSGRFRDLGLREEVMKGLERAEMASPTEIQCVAIPAILDGKSVVFGSPSESGRTLACLLPLIQLLRQDGVQTKPRCPQAVVLCPCGEKSLQAFCMAEFFTNDVQFRPLLAIKECNSKNQHESLEDPIDMVVGTPDGVLQCFEDKKMAYSDVRFLVLDEVDSMYSSGLGPQLSKLLELLKNHPSNSADPGFQAILVTAPMTEMMGGQPNPFLQRLERDHSGELAAVLLEMDSAEVVHLIESPDALKNKVAEALVSFCSGASEHDNENHSSLSSIKK